MKYLQSLVQSINSFDPQYEETEDDEYYGKYNSIKEDIESKLEQLTEDEVYKLNKQLNKNGVTVMDMYFTYWYTR